MTTFAMDRIALRSPDALLAAVPYLLGFHPVESAVLVWMRGGRLILTQRIDLPPTPDALPAWSAAVWSHEAAAIADELVLVIASTHAADPELLSAIVERATSLGIAMRDMLRLDGERWWSLLCSDPDCCPPEGRRIDESARSAVGAEFTVQGRAPLVDREALERLFANDEALAAEVATCVAAAASAGGRVERWRDRRIRRIAAVLASSAPMSAEDIAEVVTGLSDVRVRDTLLWDAARWSTDDVERAIDRLARATSGAPAGLVAPVATVASLLSWLCGDGARALTALDRARADDPEYSLALLLAASLEAGLNPQRWREAMASLTRTVCRYGTPAMR